MKRLILISLLVCSTMFTVRGVIADELNIKDGDTIKSILVKQVGKRVSITMKSGQELSGVLASVTDEVSHISELTGKEFYDAVVSTDRIETIIIRTK